MKISSFLSVFLMAGALQMGMAQQPEPLRGTVDVMGEASVKLAPDYAQISIVVEKEAKLPAEAQQSTMKEMSEVLTYLRSIKNISDVKTQVVELRPRIRDYQKGEKDYYARQVVSFKLMKLEQYDEVILGLLQKGIDGIGQVQFRSSSEEKLEESLLKQAVADARNKASLLAGELGQEIGKAVFITDRNGSGAYPRYEGARMMKMDSGPSVEPGELELSVTVNVRFELN